MPGMRLNFNKTDEKLLKLFFSHRNSRTSTFFQLHDSWKSTEELTKELPENKPRVKKQLLKLTSFGMVDHIEVYCGKRTDHYWYPTHEGVYVMMYMIKNFQDIKRFLDSNTHRNSDFIKMNEIIQTNDPRFRYVISQFENIIKNKQYYLIRILIKEWLINNVGYSGRARLLQPSPKPKLKQVYGKNKEMMKKLSKLYGKFE